MTRQHILDEIKRTAKANGGTALGRQKFFKETGIREADWYGKHWARWSDAVSEAGFTPNQKFQRYDAEVLLKAYISLARELGRMPAAGDVRLKARRDPEFPSHTALDRLGPKRVIISKIADYCRQNQGYEDVLAFCNTAVPDDSPKQDDCLTEQNEFGFVYLLKSGRYYKIGRSNACGRRARELAIQLPEKASLVHQIRTDDPSGIEAYWHNRFAPYRKNGEWFDLSAAQVAAFKRRKFM